MNAYLSSVCVALAVLLAAGPAPAAERTTDVRQLRAILTGPGRAELDVKAAQTLARTLETMYGVKVPVNPEGMSPSPEARNVLLVGRDAAVAAGMVAAADLERVKYDGFIIEAREERIAVAGFRPRGSVYGAYALLERLGCHFYTASCEVVPKPATPVVAAFHQAEKPAIEFRTGSSWALRHSLGDQGDPRQGANPELFTPQAGSDLWTDHTSGYLVPKLLYMDQHPEYYAMRRDGTRLPKKTSDAWIHLCLSNPDVVSIATERMLAWMRLHPEQRFFFITQGDGVDWCQCPNCKAMDVVPGQYADRYVKFLNQLARAAQKEFPDKILLGLAYCGTDDGPVREQPEKNIWMMYCPYWGVALSEVHPLTHPANAEALRQLESWLKVAPGRVGIYDYNMYYTPSWDAMAEKVKWYAGKGIKGILFCGRPTCFSEMFTYVMAKLMWNPSLDTEKLKAEFVAAYYGPAAPQVAQYLRLLKNRLAQGYPKGIHEWYMPPAFYSAGFTRKCLALFDGMAQAAARDPALLKQVTNERSLFVDDLLTSIALGRTGVTKEQWQAALPSFEGYLGTALADLQKADVSLAAPGLAPAQLAPLQKQKAELLSKLTNRLKGFAGLALPAGADPAAVAREFLAAPDAAIRRYPRQEPKPTAPEVGPGSVRLPATAFTGGDGPRDYDWFCELRTAMGAYAAKSPRSSRMKAEFTLEAPPAGEATLKIEGQDADKDSPPPTQLSLLLNGEPIFSGPCGFVKRGWSWRSFPVAKGILRAGKNTLEVLNNSQSARLDHYWFFLSEARLKWAVGQRK